MRFELIRLVSRDTDWQPAFALRDQERHELVTDSCNAAQVFDHPTKAFRYVQSRFGDYASVEWEGSIY